MIFVDIQKLLESQASEGRILPRYEDYCIANVVSGVAYLFGAESAAPLASVFNRAGLQPNNRYRIINFVIDGFGYHQLLHALDHHPFLKIMVDQGSLAPLTSVFPSTTAAALTTLHTGLTPQQHGLPEWLVYFEELQKVIYTLPFTSLGEVGRDTLVAEGVDPKILFSGQTFYQFLAERGVRSFAFTNNAYANSAYSTLIHKGSEIVPFENLHDLFTRLRNKLESTSGPAYFYVYWNGLDTAAHTHGPNGEDSQTALREYFDHFENELVKLLDPKAAEDTLLLMTADHGQILVDPEETVYLSDYPEVVENLRLNNAGEPIVPWGSARDIFIGLKPDKVDVVYDFLRSTLSGKATVHRVDEILRAGWFGCGGVDKRFRSKLGDLLILAEGSHTVWYEHVPDQKFHLCGIHGGLSADEMLVPLFMARLKNLQT